MPRLATGTLYQNPPNSGIYYVQLTLGKTHLGKPKRRSFALPTCKNEADAQERMELLAGLARRLRDAGREDLVEELVDRAASAEGRALDEVLRTADLIIAGKLAGMPKDADPIPTILQLGTLWTSGELHKQFPDHIKNKSTADDDAGRLEKHVYPVIGEIPIDAFTLDHANLVMAGIPAGRAPATRRHIAQLLHRICAMALFPLRIIETNPLPEGFLPPVPSGKAKSWLYPDEDAKLLSAKPVPLAWRVFYGFLHREGLRFSEAVRLIWSDVDLERGVLVLDKNKDGGASCLGVISRRSRWSACMACFARARWCLGRAKRSGLRQRAWQADPREPRSAPLSRAPDARADHAWDPLRAHDDAATDSGARHASHLRDDFACEREVRGVGHGPDGAQVVVDDKSLPPSRPDRGGAASR